MPFVLVWGTQAVSETANFSIRYRVTGGPVMADGYTERYRALTISGADGVAEHEKLRSASDAPGEPIGLFRTTLPPARLESLLKIARSSGLGGLPRPDAGGPGTSVLEISFRDGSTEQKAVFTTMDVPIIQRVEELLAELDGLGASLDAHPVAAASLTVAVEGTSRFKYTLTNIGRQPLCVGDPRRLPASHPDHYATVATAWYPAERLGFTAPPLLWRHIGLTEGQAGDSALVLPPGGSISADTGTWKPEHPGERHLVQAVWVDYRGLAASPTCYRLRGSLFSAGIEVVPR